MSKLLDLVRRPIYADTSATYLRLTFLLLYPLIDLPAIQTLKSRLSVKKQLPLVPEMLLSSRGTQRADKAQLLSQTL